MKVWINMLTFLVQCMSWNRVRCSKCFGYVLFYAIQWHIVLYICWSKVFSMPWCKIVHFVERSVIQKYQVELGRRTLSKGRGFSATVLSVFTSLGKVFLLSCPRSSNNYYFIRGICLIQHLWLKVRTVDN